jgi:hypothetical protein
MQPADNMALWIGGLADSDPAKRQFAAKQLHSAASALARPAIDLWRGNAEFRELLHPTGFVAGIAVGPQTFAAIRAANGSPRLADVPADQDAIEFELQFGEQVDLDILTTREPAGSGAIERYLQKFGEGIQQIEIFSTNLDRATEILRAHFNLSPIYPATRAGADGTRVNFFLAPAPEGKKVLIEIVEASKGRS